MCCVDTDSFIVYIKTDDTYKDVAEGVETRFDTSNYELDRAKSKEVSGLMKDELGGNIMAKFIGLRKKMYGYLIDASNEDKKAKGTKKCVIKGNSKLENYKTCLEPTQLESKINHLEKNKINTNSISYKTMK